MDTTVARILPVTNNIKENGCTETRHNRLPSDIQVSYTIQGRKGSSIHVKTTGVQNLPVTNIKKRLVIVRRGTADSHQEYKSHNTRKKREIN